VKSIAVANPVRRFWVALLLTAIALPPACSKQKPQQAPDAATLLKSVAPADPAKLPSLDSKSHWSNPYLVIRPQTVGLLTDANASEEQLLKPTEVLNALA
jgi:hypothetical protein